MHKPTAVASLIAVLALSLVASASSPQPGWDTAATEVHSHWQKKHPDDTVLSLQRIPEIPFSSQGEWVEITYPFELKVKRATGDKTLKVGAKYRATGGAPYVFTGITEDVEKDLGKALTAPPEPLLDDKNAKLLRAVKEGNLAGVQAALAAGATVEAKDEQGLPALLLAAADGQAKCVKLLLDKGAQVDAVADGLGTTALMAAAAKPGNGETVRLLLDKRASVHAQNRAGHTALMYASDAEVAKMLLSKGAAVDAKSRSGDTALMAAARGGRLDVVKLLLEKGADPNAKEAEGRTALMAAASTHANVAKLLLDKHADVNAKDLSGRTALQVAMTMDAWEVAKLLLNRGSDPNVRDRDGRTPLMMAAQRGSLEVVKLLVDKGADVVAKDPQGRTAMNHAADYAQGEIIGYLREREASARSASPRPTETSKSAGAVASGKPELDARTCSDPCALLTVAAYDDLVAGACKLRKKHDTTFCEIDFPWSDVPSCDAYDELRNCIYARFGYVFSKTKWQEQFGKQPWYKPDPSFTEAKLPPVAKANVQKLKDLKAKRQGCQ
jgi:uncharacterized protein